MVFKGLEEPLSAFATTKVRLTDASVLRLPENTGYLARLCAYCRIYYFVNTQRSFGSIFLIPMGFNMPSDNDLKLIIKSTTTAIVIIMKKSTNSSFCLGLKNRSSFKQKEFSVCCLNPGRETVFLTDQVHPLTWQRALTPGHMTAVNNESQRLIAAHN